MKKFLSMINENIYYKTTFWSISLLLILTAILSFLFPLGFMDIPLGGILGMFVSSLFFFVNGLITNKEVKIRNAKITMIIFWLRIIFLGGIMILISVLYYHYNIHVFNIFSFVVGYLISVGVFVLLVLKESKKE